MESRKIFKIALLAFTGLVASCNHNDVKSNDIIVYDNIVVLSDVTNRITNPNYAKPIHDTVIVNELVDYFVTNIVKPGKTINPQHVFNFYSLNPLKVNNCNLKSKIDLEDLPNSTIKSAYVNSKGSGEKLKNDVAQLKKRIKCEYSKPDISGDILNGLNSILKINENIKSADTLYDKDNDLSKTWRNSIFVFTDGYLEFNGMEKSKFSTSHKTDEIRSICLRDHINPETAIEKNPMFKFQPIRNQAFNQSRLFLFETYDRSINKTTGVSGSPISDQEILKALWSKWAKESGFIKIEYFPFISNKSDIGPRIHRLFNSSL